MRNAKVPTPLPQRLKIGLLTLLLALLSTLLWGIFPTLASPEPSFDELVQQAFLATNQGNFSQAEALWSLLLDRDPDNPALWTNRGNARVSQHHLTLALEDFDQAVKLAPEAPDPYLNRGVAHEGLGEWQAALEDYNRVIALDPTDAMAFNNRGNAYAGLGNWELALADYKHAVELEPKFIFAQANVVLAKYQLGETAAAMQGMRNLVRKYPQFADMRAALAVSLWHEHRQAEAESHWVAVEGLDKRYTDRDWLVRDRRWPPRLIAAWDEFSSLSRS